MVTQGSGLGEWKYSAASDWRSGFFPGALWQIELELSALWT